MKQALSMSVGKGFRTLTFVVSCLLLLPPSLARAPLKNADFDNRTLTRENFHAVLEPAARREGNLMLYSAAGGFEDIWKSGLIPRFEARYGVRVHFRNVRNRMANQQLMAVHRAHKNSPADVYMAGGSDNFTALSRSGVIAELDLGALLPALATVPRSATDVVFGVPTGGSWPVVHLGQNAIAYDSAAVPASEVPTRYEDLLVWAERHPRRFVMTSPAKGGAGGAFLFSLARHLASDDVCRNALYRTDVTTEEARAWAMSTPCLEPTWAYLRRLIRVSELANGNADTLNLLNNGQATMGTVWEDQVLRFQRARLLPPSLRLQLLANGQAESGDGLIVPANAVHPAAALLFIDMALGSEFQSWKLATYGSRSARPDVRAQAVLDPETSTWMVPPQQYRSLSVPMNWTLARAMTTAFEDKVLSQR